MRRLIIFSITLFIAIISAFAKDPTLTDYTFDDCRGSSKPYPIPIKMSEYPDSLHPVSLNHVGRHGSRFPTSAARALTMQRALRHADSISTITPLGRELLDITDFIIEHCNGRWGALDSLGMAEQRGLASRMFASYPELFNEAAINAVSSYSPRCVMSMYEFTHQLTRLNNRINVTASSGRNYSPLVRPFDLDADYRAFLDLRPWSDAYDQFVKSTVPVEPIGRVLGEDYPLDIVDKQHLAIVEYELLASLGAMSYDIELDKFFKGDELNRLWASQNLLQYLRRSSSTLSTAPADIASRLLVDIIEKIDCAVAGDNVSTVELRFGHAETIIPLLALMRIEDAYYMTNYFDTVALHWRNFDIVPMGANVQIVLFKAQRSGIYYVRLDLNEITVPLLPGQNDHYVPWSEARDFLVKCLPLHIQPE